ncbi:fatty acid CoA ligase Acsl3-like isoform X1 [Tachypleus tridentatus]|uniref:fatty acid CoA ligase Acsl3-like isoform X1 n=2 Tax=Tachypleus tridentatus TaxID=6853 RepID=UPI003FD335E3
MASSTGTVLVLNFIKTFMLLYDIISLPFYIILQRPWRQWLRSPVWGEYQKPRDISSPLVRIDKTEPFLPGIETVDQVFRYSVKRFSNTKCFGTREIKGEEEEVQKDGKVFKKLILGDYKWLTYEEANKRVELFGKGLMSIGVQPRQNVVIFAETRVEWMIAAQACLRFNIPVVTLYATLGEEGIIHGINETEVTHIITSQELLGKLKKIIDKIPLVKYIIYMEAFENPNLSGFPNSVEVQPFSRVEKLGEDADLELTGEVPGPEDTAIIMYTSGSTGIPKGVMISHKNIVATSNGFSTLADKLKNKEVFLAFLPLAHVLELAVENFFLAKGIPIGYSSPHTMTDKSTAVKSGCKGDASLLKPTIILAVPLILDRIRKSVTEIAEGKGGFSKAFFRFAIKYKLWWIKKGFRTPLLDKIVFKKVRQLIGGQLRSVVCGGAPLSPDTHQFIRATLSGTTIQGYGLTETTAGTTTMGVGDNSTGRVGPPLKGCYVCLDDWEEGGYYKTDKPNPRGEIMVGGNTVTKGYYKNEALTRECYHEEDGIRWFHTGDIGEIYPDGTIKIIDRKKDLVKLQQGEYVSLGKVEAELKTCSLLDNICVYGDSFETYLVALAVPNAKQLQQLAKTLHKDHLVFSEMCQDTEVFSAFQKALVDHAKKALLQRVEIPTKIKLVTEEWTPDSGLVTAAFKLRRKVIQNFYKSDIEAMYGRNSNSAVLS